MTDTPQTIASTRQAISQDIQVSIKTDRTLVIELGKNTVVVLSPVEARALLAYLQHHHYYFQIERG
jgi:hypothetical protein